MSITYLGKKNNVVTVEKLKELTNFDRSTSITGDITWMEFNDNGKEILIAERVISFCPWDFLNSKSLVFGKYIKIGNKIYLCRIMTGQKENAFEKGGEWNKYIVNFGVPYSSNISHVWCQDYPYGFSQNLRVWRSYSGDIDYFDNSYSYNNGGWLPFLEFICSIEDMPNLLEKNLSLAEVLKSVEEVSSVCQSWHTSLINILKLKGINVNSEEKMADLILNLLNL